MSNGFDEQRCKFNDLKQKYLAFIQRTCVPREQPCDSRKPTYIVPKGTLAKFFSLEHSQALPAASSYPDLPWREHRTHRQHKFHQLVDERDGEMYFVNSGWLIAVSSSCVRVCRPQHKLDRPATS